MWQEKFAGEGNVRGTAFKVKASLELPRKPVFGLACFGRLYEKESGFHGCEQARPDGLRSLFLRALRARTAQPSGPADFLCGSARGGPPFRCGETSGLEGNALCGALHLIRFAALSTFPLRGSSAEGGDEV